MPPRKRKASTKVAAPVTKKARIEDASVLDEPETSIPTRPKRMSVSTPQYNFTRPKKSNKKQADDGPKAKETVTSTTDTPKRRGRPPKNAATTQTESEIVPTARAAVRGRPKAKDAPAKSSAKQDSADQADGEPVVRKRGRPRKSENANAVNAQPAKSTTTPKNKAVAQKKDTKPVKATRKRTEVPRKGGERPRVKNRVQTVASLDDIKVDDTSDAENLIAEAPDTDDEQSESQYWLMKAEPNDRFEKGINVKFSIDDLAAADGPEPWDGVRNYVARNNMRAMRKGDLAFFYHSNCQVPAIVGIVRIVQEHTTDKSAFDPNHPYYDPKSSPSNPKWDCVHVEFVKKFDTQVTLKMLQEVKNKSGVVANMQLLRQSRLSVSGVTPKEWKFILGMASEDEHVGEDDGPAREKDGYESETDGEVDPGPNEELNGVIANGGDEAAAAEVESAEASNVV